MGLEKVPLKQTSCEISSCLITSFLPFPTRAFTLGTYNVLRAVPDMRVKMSIQKTANPHVGLRVGFLC